MTARVTTLRGGHAGRYYTEGPGRYYLDGSEPPGIWAGSAARELGLAGDVDDDAFVALLAGEDPRSGVLLGSAHTERTVRGFDVTFSAPKSVSVLMALGDSGTRGAVLGAHDAAVEAVLGWIEGHAHTRYRVGGQLRIVGAEGVVAAVFRQHLSRELDPQLHSHVVIANRVLAPDGRWLALDARALKHDQRTVSALYHAGLRAELTQRLGVRWEAPVNGIAEMADLPVELRAEFSTRSKEVAKRIDVKLDRFVETMGREPSWRERWNLEREAVRDSRPAKDESDAASLVDEWVEGARGLGFEPRELVDEVVGSCRALPEVGVDELTQDALAALEERQSTWRPAEIVREAAGALPTTLTATAGEVVALAEAARGHAEAGLVVELSAPVPDGVALRRDGRPVTESVLQRALTTPAVLAEEARLLARVERRLETPGEDAPELPDTAVELTGPQVEAAAAVAGTHELVLVVGPAGAGKTAALAPAVQQLLLEGREVFGASPSATAAEVLADGTGVRADTLDKLLVEHRLARQPAPELALGVGATVIVDEAAMVPTARLSELIALADEHAWRLVLVGDPLQFAAVGRGGMFGYLVDRHDAIHLDRVHRFTEPWERDASLRLRRGDPDVITIYESHGRLHGGTVDGMADAAIDAWWDSREAGRRVALMAPTRDAVEDLNLRAQQRLLDAGRLPETGRTIECGPYQVGVGDEITTRRNDRTLRTDRDEMVRNRDHWIVTAVREDGSLTAVGRSGVVVLPADYVDGQVELGYAETSHASQGRTVDDAILYLDGPTDTRGIYVPLTRGRHANHAYIALGEDHDTPADVLVESLGRDWIDRPAHQIRDELRLPLPARETEPVDRRLHGHELADAITEVHDLNRLLAYPAITDTEVQRLEQWIQTMETQRTGQIEQLRDLRDDLAAAEAVIETHDGPVARRLHRGSLADAHDTVRTLGGEIDRTERTLGGLDTEIPKQRGDLDHRLRLRERRPDQQQRLRALAGRLTGDWQDRLAAIERGDIPRAAIQELGPPPVGGELLDQWNAAAAAIDRHHDAFTIGADDTLGLDRVVGLRLTSALDGQDVDRVVDDYRHAAGIQPPQRVVEHELPGLGL